MPHQSLTLRSGAPPLAERCAYLVRLLNEFGLLTEDEYAPAVAQIETIVAKQLMVARTNRAPSRSWMFADADEMGVFCLDVGVEAGCDEGWHVE
jgi:hypothetical protein